MASFSTIVSNYIKSVIDSLRTGGLGWASAKLAFGSSTSAFLVTARQPGAGGNAITVAVTVPSGDHPLTISVSGSAITIALSVLSGVAQSADNTALLICNALNASTDASALVVASLTGSGAGHLSIAASATALAGGVDGSHSQPLNFLRAQDMATVLDLMQDGLDQPAEMDAVATGSTTTLVEEAATFVPSQQIGNIVVFEADTTTTALQGLSFRILANSDSTLTLETMPAATASGDTYTIRGGIFDDAIAELREGHGLADAPRGSVFGDFRIVQHALTKAVETLGGVQASDVLTFSGGNALNTETVTIGGKVYTFQDTLTNVDGHVLIGTGGSAVADSITALKNAINLGSGSGSTYAAATTLNASVSAVATTTTLTVTARSVGGAGGNAIAVSETLTHATWASTTLTGGTTAALTAQTVASLLVGTGSTTTKVVVDTTTKGKMRIDQYKGMVITISGEDRTCLGNDETSMLMNKALTSAPSSSTAIAVAMPESYGGKFFRASRVHPGGQPTNNVKLADHIEQVEKAIIDYVLPV